MIQTEYPLVSVGVSVGFKNMQSEVQSCMSGVKGTPKGTQKLKKVKPYLKLMASVQLDYGVSLAQVS